MDIKVLRQRLHDAKAKGRDLLAKINGGEGREATEEESATLAAIRADIQDLEAQIARAEELLDLERVMAPLASPLESAPAPTGDQALPLPAENWGFDNLADYALAVRAATAPGGGVLDPRLATIARGGGIYGQPTNFHQEGGAASGEGYMVPPAFRTEIWEVVFDDEGILSTVDMEPTASNAVEFVRDETTPWGSSGVQANWEAEGVQLTPSKLVTKAEMLRLNKLYAFVLATEELLEDAPRLNNRLTRKAGQAIRWKADDALIYGTGTGQPLGWFNSAALVSVAKEGGQAADTIETANVAKMFSRLLPQGLARAYWLANSDTLPQIMVMTISNQPIWTPPNAGLAQAPGGLLMGRPIRLSEHAKTIGDKGDIQFIDPMGYYATVKRGGIKFAQSIHLYFDYDMQAFRWTFRLAGQPYLSAPIAANNGPNTKSHFVTLDERA